ncbi:hypothetical protein [Dechloromonas sp. A34]|nr:hypothetical protein [Dechloromonas sp. A34]
MQHDDISRELVALEQEFWHAIKNQDAATGDALSDDPCVVAADPYGRH